VRANLLAGEYVVWALADEIHSLANAHPCTEASLPALSQRGLVAVQASEIAAGSTPQRAQREREQHSQQSNSEIYPTVPWQSMKGILW